MYRAALVLGCVFSSLACVAGAAAADGPDDCEFIRAAIRATPPSGGQIQIPAGTFNCRAMIVINRSHIDLRGAGRDKTLLRLADASASPMLVIGDDQMAQSGSGEWIPATRVTDVRVSDFTIDGNREHQDVSQECGHHACDGDVASIRNNGITIRGASRITVAHVTSHSNISGGLVTEKHCDHLYVHHFSSTDNHFDGFAGYQTEDSLFEDLDLSRNRSAGISLDIDFTRNHFRRAIMHWNGDVGIFARDIRSVIFEKLSIHNSGNHGVFMSATEGPQTCASNNEFRSVSIVGSKGFGIFLGDGCPGNKITGASRLQENRDGCYTAPGGLIEAGKEVRCSP